MMKVKMNNYTPPRPLFIEGEIALSHFEKRQAHKAGSVIVLILTLCTLTISAQEYKIAKDAFGCGTTAMSSTEYKAIGTLSQTFVGISEDNSNKSFAGFWYNLGEAPISVESDLINNSEILKIYPNPFNTVTTIEFYSDISSFTEIWLINLLGIKVVDVFEGNSEPGLNKVIISDIKIQSGIYFIVLKTSEKKISIPLIKM